MGENGVLLICAFLAGFVSGLRTFLAATVVSWGARLRVFSLAGTPLAWMSSSLTAIVFTLLEVCELVYDKLPQAGSRKAPRPFIARILAGALSGATLGASRHSILLGLLLGAAGAIAGTFTGAACRAKLASLFGRDWPAAVLEDLAGIGIALFAVLSLR